MLQKPQTKFGYARRIFALPVLFSVAFAYMVNAKNKEIKATNIEIAKAVYQIKKDTIRPEKAKEFDAVAPRAVKRSETQKKLTDLSKKIGEKSLALKGLKPESDEFKKKVDELGALSAEMGKITSSDDFRMAYSMNDADVKKINEYFKSDEWKGKVNELKTNMNIEIPEMPEMDFDFPEPPLPPTPPNSPDAPNAPRVKVYTFKDVKDMKWSPEAAMTFKSAENTKESAATAKKRAGIERKRAKLNEKRAKLDGEKAKLDAERRALDGDKRVYVYSNTFKPMKFDNVRVMTMDNNARIIKGSGLQKYSGDTENMKFYIDGKEVTKKEMDALNPNDIRNMNINKRARDGSSSGEIRIETKK